MHEVNGNYQFDITVPKGKGSGIEEVSQDSDTGDKDKSGFARQGTFATDLFW